MANFKYTYSVVNDFQNKKVSVDKLTQEIQTSAIVIAIDYLNVSGDVCDIYFKDSLTAGDNLILDDIISTHDGIPVENPETSDGIPIVTLNKLQEDNIPQIALSPRVGSEIVIGTHNFCDQTTWFDQSIRVENQPMTAKDGYDGYVWKCDGYSNWIDLVTGRVHNQEKWAAESDHGYSVIIKVDDVEKTLCSPFDFNFVSGDYWIDYDNAEIHFSTSMTGSTVTATFSYAQGSLFRIKPYEGKTLRIEDAETDFSQDCILNTKFGYTVVGYVDVFAPQYVRGTNEIGYALSMSYSDPPISPTLGDAYIVGTEGTGDWLGYDGYLTQWDGYSWVFTEPNEEDWLTVVDAEMYFTWRDSQWQPTPYPSLTKIPLQEDFYMRVSQIITEARGALPPVNAIGASEEEKQITDIKEFRRVSRGMKHSVQAVPFNYSTTRELHYSYGMELYVSTGDNVCVEGEMLTITFYCSSIDEVI